MATTPAKRRADAAVSGLHGIPDGPLAQIVSLVGDPHRQSLRLVCRKLCSLEAVTRTSLVFRVPGPSSSHHAYACPSPVGRGPPPAGTSLPPRQRSLIADSDSEAESEVGTPRIPGANFTPQSSSYSRPGGPPTPRLTFQERRFPPTSPATLPCLAAIEAEEKHPRLLLQTVQLESAESQGGQPSADDYQTSSERGSLELKSKSKNSLSHDQAEAGTLQAFQSDASDTETTSILPHVVLLHRQASQHGAQTDGETSEDESSPQGQHYSSKLHSYPSPSQSTSSLMPGAEAAASTPSSSATPSPRAAASLQLLPSLSTTASSFFLNNSQDEGGFGPEEVLPEDKLSRLLKRFPRISSLDICNLYPGVPGADGTLDRRLLLAVSRLAPNLSELHLSGHSLGWQVDDAALAAVAQGCPRLRKLVVHHWVVGGQGMSALADAGVLEELEMDFFARDQAQGPRRTVAEIGRCRSLTSLHLRYCNNDDVAAIAQGCAKLKKLTLLFSILGPSFSGLGCHCRDLQELTLRSCEALSPDDEPLSLLAQHCTSLTSLSLHAGHCASEQGLLRLLSSCRNLTKLSLEFKPLPHLFRLANIAPHLSQLRELTLQWVEIEDADLRTIGTHCKHLSMLVLSLRQNVTDAGIAALLQGCGEALEVLLLRVRDASDAVLPVLGSSCPRLQRLTLGLPRITGEGVLAMFLSGTGTRLQTLRRLRLWDCTALTDPCLKHFSNFCPNLEGLGLKGCSNLSSDGLSDLVNCCPKLEYLEVESRLLSGKVQEQGKHQGIYLIEASP